MSQESNIYSLDVRNQVDVYSCNDIETQSISGQAYAQSKRQRTVVTNHAWVNKRKKTVRIEPELWKLKVELFMKERKI